ncbi:uncharacterized protein LOC120625171 [Pararge aegeria]|nr:uncharacterized protein LOC120625171 [Pararge aegeria]
MLCNFSNINANIQSPPTIDGRPLNQVDSFKYLGSVINTKANTEDEIHSRINTGWLKWRSLTGVLCDAKLPIKVKGTVYKRAVRSALLYGSECWGMRKSDEQKIHVTEMKMLRWAGGITRLDKIRNEFIRGSFKVAEVQHKMQESRLRWYGHVMRRDKSHMTQRVMAIDEGKRGRGRPLTTWTRTVFNDMKTLGLTPEMTQDRIKWRTSIRRADPK